MRKVTLRANPRGTRQHDRHGPAQPFRLAASLSEVALRLDLLTAPRLGLRKQTKCWLPRVRQSGAVIELSDIDWGNAPSWGALLAATTAATFAGRNVFVDRQDRRQEQAGKVAAWWGTKLFEIETLTTGSGRPPPLPRVYSAGGAYLRNASALPVYEAAIKFFRDGQQVHRLECRVVPPREDPEFLEPEDADDETLPPWERSNSSLDVALHFRDAAGRRWYRSVDGRLQGPQD